MENLLNRSGAFSASWSVSSPTYITTVSATLEHNCGSRLTTACMHMTLPTEATPPFEAADTWLLEVWKWWHKQYSMTPFWCQHVQICNSNRWICLVSQHHVVLDSVSRVLAIMQQLNLDYNCLVDVPLMLMLWWNAFKECIPNTEMCTQHSTHNEQE